MAGQGRHGDDHGKHRTVAEMIHQRIGDFEAFKDYQRAVFERTEAHLATIDRVADPCGDCASLPSTGRNHLQRTMRR